MDPFSFDNPNKVCADFQSLDFCSPGEAEEILCIDILQYYKQDEAVAILEHLLSKLAKGGTLTLSGVNVYEVCRKYVIGQINTEKFNELVYSGRNSSFTLDDLVNYFNQKQYKILEKKINGFNFVLKVAR